MIKRSFIAYEKKRSKRSHDVRKEVWELISTLIPMNATMERNGEMLTVKYKTPKGWGELTLNVKELPPIIGK